MIVDSRLCPCDIVIVFVLVNSLGCPLVRYIKLVCLERTMRTEVINLIPLGFFIVSFIWYLIALFDTSSKFSWKPVRGYRLVLHDMSCISWLRVNHYWIRCTYIGMMLACYLVIICRSYGYLKVEQLDFFVKNYCHRYTGRPKYQNPCKVWEM